MKFRVLIKRGQSLIYAAIIGSILLTFGYLKLMFNARDLRWFGTTILIWALLSWLARQLETEKIYALWVQILAFIVLLFLFFMILYIV